MAYTVGLMGIYVKIKLKNYLNQIFLCGQETQTIKKKNTQTSLSRLLILNSTGSLNTSFIPLVEPVQCWFLKHNFGGIYQKWKSNSSPECTDKGYFELFLVSIGWTGGCVLCLEGKHWKKIFSWLSILKCSYAGKCQGRCVSGLFCPHKYN